jgi:hypothetical protein
VIDPNLNAVVRRAPQSAGRIEFHAWFAHFVFIT